MRHSINASCMSSSNLRPAAAVVLTVIATSAGIWYIHKTQAWEREVRRDYPTPSSSPAVLSCLAPSCMQLEVHHPAVQDPGRAY